ncbi:MAG: outer membrane beta-barrel protein, partial [Bacteroidales bacterium]|nr:outer membrane beta-barrel protein [Bacteroidales bacterium]
SARLEEKIDSLNYIIGRINAKFVGNRKNDISSTLYTTPLLDAINEYSTGYQYKLNQISTDALVIYNHKFMKPRRSLSISVQNENALSYKKENEDNINEFFNATSEDERTKVATSQNTNENILKSSIMYVEPFGKRLSLSTFYNFSMNTERLTNDALDEINNNSSIDSLNLVSKRELFYNRLGVSLNYSYKELYFLVGLAYKNLQQNGDYTKANVDGDPLRKNYGSVTPIFTLIYEFENGMWFDCHYSYDITEPSFTYLQPISTNTNPLYIVLGNPDLSYTSEHSASYSLGYHNKSSFFSIYGYVSYSYEPDLITYNQHISYIDGLGYRNVRKPEIVHNGHDVSTTIHTGIPIVKSKLDMNVSASYSYGQNPTFINEVENETKSNTISPKLSLQINLSDKLTWRINGRYSYNTTTYESSSYFNRNITHSVNAGTSIKWQIFGRTYFEANYSYSKYANNEFANNPDIHNLNVSIKQYLGKGNKFELRLAACDLLNQSVSIAQYASANTVFYRESPTLSRYYMLTFSYNMRGFQNHDRGPMHEWD